MTTFLKLNRRTLLAQTGTALLAAQLWPGALAAGEPAAGKFTFIAVNDLHYLDDKSGPWLEKVVKQMNAHDPAPKFVLVVGDVTEHATAAQVKPAKEILDTLQVPYYTVIGNHDYLDQQDRSTYDKAFPGRINYHFEHAGWQFLGLDSSDGKKYQQVSVAADSLKWLETAVAKLNPKQPTVLFTHFPFGSLVPYQLQNVDAVLERLKEVNLQAIFNGHFHGWTERTVAGTLATTNRCCSIARKNHDLSVEKGYLLCRAEEGKISREFVEVKP